METYEYKVVPFTGTIQAGQPGLIVGRQLESVINDMSRQGWEFHAFNDVDVEVKPGCLQALFGAKSSFMPLDQLVFRRPATPEREVPPVVQ